MPSRVTGLLVALAHVSYGRRGPPSMFVWVWRGHALAVVGPFRVVVAQLGSGTNGASRAIRCTHTTTALLTCGTRRRAPIPLNAQAVFGVQFTGCLGAAQQSQHHTGKPTHDTVVQSHERYCTAVP